MKKVYLYLGFFLMLVLIGFGIFKTGFNLIGHTISENQAEISNTYIYAGSLLASKSSENPSETKYYIQDHLGNNKEIINGELIEQDIDYYAFGESKKIVDNGNNYLYTGKEFDDETYLYYYGARYYNPELGRFMQADALIGDISNPLSLNRYVYVKNNPLKYIDPSGNAAMVFPDSTITKNYQNFKENHPILSTFYNPYDVNNVLMTQNVGSTGIKLAKGPVQKFVGKLTEKVINKIDDTFKNVGGIKRFLFRGDDIKPEKAFKNGLQAGDDWSITPQDHLNEAVEGQAYFDDPFKSATTEINVAGEYAKEGGYIYCLAETSGRTLDPSKMNLKALVEKGEILFKGTIKPKEIIGARKVRAIFRNWENEEIEELLLGEFIPNPKYKD